MEQHQMSWKRRVDSMWQQRRCLINANMTYQACCVIKPEGGAYKLPHTTTPVEPSVAR